MFSLLLSLAGSPPAWAQSTESLPSPDLAEEADLHFKMGIRSYLAGHYESALEHLLASNRLVPNRNVLFNIASTYFQLGNYDAAYRHFTEFLEGETRPEPIAEAKAMMKRFTKEIALVRIESSPPGADVYVDRRNLGSRGKTPLSLALRPGEHHILLDLPGHEPEDVLTTAERGAEKEVRVDLEAILGTVRLQGAPLGAEIRIGDESSPVVGTLPTSLELPPGPHILVIGSPGFATARKLVEVSANQSTDALVELDVVRGKLVVDPLVSQALIEVDGTAAGFTPAVLDLPVGEHRIRVSRPGFRPIEGQVAIREDQSVIFEGALQPFAEVTGASRSSEAVEDAPASVSIITDEEIRAFAYQDLYDALGGTRGVFQNSDLTYTYLGFRGFSRQENYGNRLLTTLDGHVLNDDQLGASYTSNDLMTDLRDVRRIEVIRGPGSALYGSNAFFGVLNLVTWAREAPPPPHVSITGNGQRTVRGRVGAGLGDADAGAWLSVAGLTSEGATYRFPELAGYSHLSEDGTIEDRDGNRSATGSGSAWIGDLTVQAFYTGRVKQSPYPMYETRPADPRGSSRDFRGFVELRYEPELSRTTRLLSRAYLDRYTFRGQYPYFPRLYVDRWKGTWAGAEPRLVTEPTEWLTLTFGAEAKAELAAQMDTQVHRASVDDEPIETLVDEQPSFSTLSGYGIGAVGGSLFRLHLGLRYDYLLLPEGASDPNVDAISPRISLVSHPSDRTALKVVLGRAFRAPSPYEYLYNDGGQTQVRADQLRPEIISTAEAEWTQRLSSSTTLVVAGYGNQIADLLDTEVIDETGTFRFANVAETTRTVGGEVELRRDWREGWMAASQVSLQRTVVGDLLEDDPITYSPALLSSLKLAAPVIPSLVTLASRLVVESPRPLVSGQTPWIAAWDLTASGQVPSLPAAWAVGVRNLLDWEIEHPGITGDPVATLPQPGRTFLLSVTAELPRRAVRPAD